MNSARPDLEPLRPGFFARATARLGGLARHRDAERYLGLLAFFESSFFPLPVETMLVPMVLARPLRWWRFAVLSTIASFVGGLWGYALGHYGAGAIEPVLAKLGYGPAFEGVLDMFERWGFFAVLVAGFSPLRFKLFTIGAGLLSVGIVPFAIVSIIGRGLRFVIVAWTVARLGPRFANVVAPRVEAFGWICVVGFVALIAWTVFAP